MLIAAVLGAGLALRLHHYLVARSLWIDEARLAIEIGSRSFAELLKPLHYDQSAPPLFLWAVKASSQLFGMNENALRLVPFVAGLACVLLLVRIARRLLQPLGTALAVGIFSLSPTVIYYSNELKPYIVDVAVSLWLVTSSLDWLESPMSKRRLLLLTFSGAVAVWASTPAAFSLVAIVAASAVTWYGSERRQVPAVLLGVTGIWIGSFVAAYVLVYRATAANPYLAAFWSPSFFNPGVPEFPYNVWRSVREALWGYFFGHGGAVAASPREYLSAGLPVAIAISLAVMGARRLGKHAGWGHLVLIAGPILAAAAAAAAGLFPFGARLVLFSAPLWILLVAFGAEGLTAWFAPPLKHYAEAVLLTAAFALPAFYSVTDALRPTRPEHTRPLFAALAASHSPGEPVYVLSGGLPAWVFYTTDWRNPDAAELEFYAEIGSSGGPVFENAGPRGGPVSGDGLSGSSAGYPVLYGTPTGLLQRSSGDPINDSMDAGWARHEAERIRMRADPTAWVFLSHYYGPELRLLDTLAALGGVAEDTLVQPGAALLRYRFPAGDRVE